MVSMVPLSYSRAITSEVSMAPAIMMITAMSPGIMNFLLSRSSLNQILTRPSTGGFIFSMPFLLRNCRRSFWLYPSINALMYARAMFEKLGSLPSMSTWTGISLFECMPRAKPGGMITPTAAQPLSRYSVTSLVSRRKPFTWK